MQKLNELMSKACLASELSKKGITVDLQMLSQVRDEVWAINRRAEAAEAEIKHQLNVNAVVCKSHQKAVSERDALLSKLAELEKQKPVGTVSIAMDWNTHRNIATVNMRPDLVLAEMKDGDELFTRPAPAADLVSVQEAWEACGGNPGIKATREELLKVLRLMDEAEDEAEAAIPAINLEELVPPKMVATADMVLNDIIEASIDGWNDCRDAITRNIEQAK